MVPVAEPVHCWLRRPVGHGLRERRRYPALAVLRRFPTDQALLFARAAATQRQQDRLLDTRRILRFRQQPLGIGMELRLKALAAATPGHGERLSMAARAHALLSASPLVIPFSRDCHDGI